MIKIGLPIKKPRKCEVFLLLCPGEPVGHRIHHPFEYGWLPGIVSQILLENAVGDAVMFEQLLVISRLQVSHINTTCLFQVKLGFDEVGIRQHINHLRLVKKNLGAFFPIGTRNERQERQGQNPRVLFHGVSFQPPRGT